MTVKQSFSMVFVSSVGNHAQPVVMRVEQQLEHSLCTFHGKLHSYVFYESWTPAGECFLPAICSNNVPPDVMSVEQSVSMFLLVLFETMLCLLL